MTNDELTKIIINAVQHQASSYMTWQLIFAIIIIGLMIIIGAYLRQKGKEYAKREHIEQITKVVEDIKLNNAREFERIAQENRFSLSASEQKHDLRLAALDKRLEAHQKAYSLWYRLRGSIRDENQLFKIFQQCNEFWMNDSLYLTEKSRKAFDEAVRAAIEFRIMKEEGNSAKMKENLNTIFGAGEVFVKSVCLPSLGENEYLEIEPKESKEKQ